MDKFDPKALHRLAKECRKAGIKNFKGFGMEFTLTDELPASNYKKKASLNQPVSNENTLIESDSLSDEDLLFWSVSAAPEQTGAE